METILAIQLFFFVLFGTLLTILAFAALIVRKDVYYAENVINKTSRPYIAYDQVGNKIKEDKSGGKAYNPSRDVDAQMSGKIIDMFD